MSRNRSDGPDATRRAVLKRLGLAVGTAYAAPVLLGLTNAKASGPSSFSDDSGRRVRRRRRRPPPRVELVVAAPDDAALTAIAAAGFQILQRARLGGLDAAIARLRAPGGLSLAQARARITALVPAATVDLNHLYRANSFACDEDGCGAFDLIGWRGGPACAARPTIGLIDTSVDLRHPALAGQAIEVLPLPQQGRGASGRQHGTAIAALLVGRADSATPGMLPEARLLAVDGFHRASSGDSADAFALVQAVDALTARRVDAINMSFAGPDNALLARVIAAADGRGIALVAAAGNAGPAAPPQYPAAYPGVIAVTAIDATHRLYRQAGRGPHIDFAAPGVRVWTAGSGGRGRFRSGTSYATPFVTAAIAAARARRPGRPLPEILAELARSAQDLGADGRDPQFGHGLIQLAAICGPGA